MAQSSRPIIIVTGANRYAEFSCDVIGLLKFDADFSGVGFGVCQRFLFQLCHTSPSDAQPQSFARQKHLDVDPDFQVPSSGCDGLTIIMACRNAKRAEAARTKLLQLLDAYVVKLKKQPGYDGHAEVFQKNVVLDTRALDLAVIGSVFKFAAGVSQTCVFLCALSLFLFDFVLNI
jgi:3-keto steroid reductase